MTGLSLSNQLSAISDFILHLLSVGATGRGIRRSTISSYLCGIHHFFSAHNLSFPDRHPQIAKLLKGVGRLDPPPTRKTPVSIALLQTCLARLNLRCPADQALWGILGVAFFFLLRCSEISADSAGSFKWFALNAEAIHLIDRSGNRTRCVKAASAVMIVLRGSKTNQRGPPTPRMLKRSGHPSICPVIAAGFLLAAHGGLPPTTPAASYQLSGNVNHYVCADAVASAIKQAAMHLGEDPATYGTHSLRAGGATHMYKAGIDQLTIQFHGRWRSYAFKSYTRLCEDSISSISTNMLGAKPGNTTLQRVHAKLHCQSN